MSLKVIGAGLPRTGTTSLKVAMEQLIGGRCYHMSELFERPQHVRSWRAAADGGNMNWDDLFAGYTAAVDTPACLFWRELMQVYPHALVVLSIRDAPSWFESCDKTIFQGARAARAAAERGAQSEWQAMMEVLARTRLPFRLAEGREAVIRAYEQHNSVVRETVPSERLLVWQAEDGWEPLCAALNVPVPNEPFPHLNTRRVWRYRRILHWAGNAVNFLTARRSASR